MNTIKRVSLVSAYRTQDLETKIAGVLAGVNADLTQQNSSIQFHYAVVPLNTTKEYYPTGTDMEYSCLIAWDQSVQTQAKEQSLPKA